MKEAEIPFRTILSLFLFLISTATVFAEGEGLGQLREKMALSFLEIEPHLALGRYLHDHDRKLLAFYVVEGARRRFGDGEFDPAFPRIFLTEKAFEDSPQAESRLLQAHKEDPASIETLKELVKLYVWRKDWQTAKQYLKEGIALRPDDFSQISTLAVIYQQEGDRPSADNIMREFSERHPKSEVAYQRRIMDLVQKDTAAARKLVKEALVAFPSDPTFHFQTALFFQQENKKKEAEQHFLKAVVLGPNLPIIQAGAGHFFLKVKEDKASALKYYLNAYFLSPHFYDGEFIESRILKLNLEIADAAFKKLLEKGADIGEISRHENPVIVGFAVNKLADPWNPKYIKPLIALMGHDDPTVRWAATDLLLKHVDRSFDPQLKALLVDPDLRKRGLSFYLAAHLWESAGIDKVKESLNAPAQLLRYDAVSALRLYGGSKGKEILVQYREKETHPRLKKMLQEIDPKK